MSALNKLVVTTQSQHGVRTAKIVARAATNNRILYLCRKSLFPQHVQQANVGEILLTEIEVVRGKEICHAPTHRHPHLDVDCRHRSSLPLLTKQFRYVTAGLLSTVLLCIGSATAWADESIVIDFVRHGQSVANAAGLIDTAVPGTELTQLGQEQAQAVANLLAPQRPFAGIFASQLIRTQETAAPLAALLGMNVQVLPGLNEINAGAFDGLPQVSLAGLVYLIGPVAWLLGLRFVPMLAPGSTDANGFEFDNRFKDALQTMHGNAVTHAKRFSDALRMMYGNALTNPVRAADGKVTEVAFSSEFAIGVGTMMNVKNPDPLLLLFDPLPETGIVVIRGNPEDGWTLVSWNGKPVSPGLLAAKTSRKSTGLCLILDVPTENGPCAARPRFTASDRVPAAPYG